MPEAPDQGEAADLPIGIRPMTGDDADEVSYVARRLPEYFHEGGVKYIGRAVEDRTGVVAVHGGQIVGFVIYDLRPPVLEILWMGVLPYYQGRGVGRRLVDSLIAGVAAGRAVKALEARTLAAHEEHEGYIRTRGFYEGMGFKLADVERGHFADGTDAAVYRLDLAE